MKTFLLKSKSEDYWHDNLLFFDLRNGEIPPHKLIMVEAENELEAVKKLQNIEFCISIGLEYWLFDPYRLVRCPGT